MVTTDARSYRFDYTSTLEDLLDAEEAERSAWVRRPFRWLLSLLGIVWLVGGLTALWTQPGWRPAVWLCLGSVVFYRLAIQPIQRRRQIRSSNAARQDVSLRLACDHLSVDVDGVGKFKRGWEELSAIENTRRGILFHFSDGIVNWLPNRVFATAAEKEQFVAFVEARIAVQGQAEP